MKFILLCLLSIIPTAIHAGQIPIINGVIGGVRNSDNTTRSRVKPAILGSSVVTPGKLRYKENSGVCETTPGVNQVSGYGDVSATTSLWFWFFESRSNPDTAPLALWFNGGPGSSSMLGLLQELGPCRITNDSRSVTLNEFSWNNEANLLFIDQPVGVGFSHGDTTTVSTSQEAAADIWTFMQIFFADPRFSKYLSNDLAIWTESYGGHYGPTFAAHFLAQNVAIDNHTVSGVKLNLKVLGIGDGLTDPLVQYAGYITYAQNNPYHALVSSSVLARGSNAWTSAGGCRDQITNCYKGTDNFLCGRAQSYCNGNVLGPLAGNWDVYYVPTANPDPYPPDISGYLNSVASTIGAESTWEQSNIDIYENFEVAGDWMRNSRPDLETVINAGVRTIIYDGDADYILNFNGVEAMVDALNTKFSSIYKTQNFSTFEVRGQSAGMYKNAGTFSYIRFFGAGHEVPAYKWGTLDVGEAAAQMFTQIMKNQSISST
ncbi:Carboxypeptidase S1 [Leucoagaricus sp. SymC.cos]|nr:Carboxypeptidase S1 [Leucoagaricus sp. SymC.cos]